MGRLEVLLDLGLGYLTLERSTPTLSPGELQRLRLATQVRSNLFGVVYVLDEPSAGLHPADTEALLRALDRLRAAGNSLFVIEHELDVIRHADWIVDVGPDAGTGGGRVLYSGPLDGLASVTASRTRRYLEPAIVEARTPRTPRGWLRLAGVTRNNLRDLEVAFPLGVMTAVTGVSGSGKSSLVSQALLELVTARLGAGGSATTAAEEAEDRLDLERAPEQPTAGRIVEGGERITRLVCVDQKPIGRTPRSNLATYTGLFDHVRKLFAATRQARARRYDAGRFSFNVAAGRCEQCAGEGFVMVELLFLPSVYTPCPTCHGARYNAKTLEIRYRERSIADVLAMTVDEAAAFFADHVGLRGSLDVLRRVGVGYLRLGQSATELSGGEAQRIKLATELQRSGRGETLYVLDEPTTGLASGRRRASAVAARRARRRRPHCGRGRARHAGHRRERLGDRHRPWRRRRGRPRRRVRRARRRRPLPQQPDRAVPGADSGADACAARGPPRLSWGAAAYCSDARHRCDLSRTDQRARALAPRGADEDRGWLGREGGDVQLWGHGGMAINHAPPTPAIRNAYEIDSRTRMRRRQNPDPSVQRELTRSRQLKKEFDAAHEQGMDALRQRDLATFGKAIEEESKILNAQRTLMTKHVADSKAAVRAAESVSRRIVKKR